MKQSMPAESCFQSLKFDCSDKALRKLLNRLSFVVQSYVSVDRTRICLAVLKNIYMFLFGELLAEFREHSVSTDPKDPCMKQVLGVLHRFLGTGGESERSKLVFVKKCFAIGDLTYHLRREILLMPKFGLKYFFDLKSSDKEEVLNQSKSFGDGRFTSLVKELSNFLFTL